MNWLRARCRWVWIRPRRCRRCRRRVTSEHRRSEEFLYSQWCMRCLFGPEP